MRNISCALTKDQIRARTKTVTRRLGWRDLQVGERLQFCEKCMGRKTGEPLVKVAVVEVVSVRREKLRRMTDELFYGIEEVKREGFSYSCHAEKWAACFIQFFCTTHSKGLNQPCTPETEITRIEFKYV